MSIYKDRYLLIFGGILEITNELNDLHLFDLKTLNWHTIEEDNKNASQSGSPKSKVLQGSDSFKKQYYSVSLPNNKKQLSRFSDSPAARSIAGGAQKLDDSTFKNRASLRGKSPNSKFNTKNNNKHSKSPTKKTLDISTT